MIFTGTFLVLLVLKLIGTIDISWWWVVSPLAAGVLWFVFWIVVLAVGQVIGGKR